MNIYCKVTEGAEFGRQDERGKRQPWAILDCKYGPRPYTRGAVARWRIFPSNVSLSCGRGTGELARWTLRPKFIIWEDAYSSYNYTYIFQNRLFE